MRRTDNAVSGAVLIGGSALIGAVAGLVVGFSWQVILLVVAAAVISGAAIMMMTSADDRRDTLRWQEAAVAVSAWASRNAGRCETTPHAFADDEWTLPGSPRFDGTILAVGRRHGFEVGVACFEESEVESGPSRHTAVFVRLPMEHPHVRMKTVLPKRAELMEIHDRELRIVYYGWPESLDLDSRVDAGVEVARALPRED